MVRQPRLGMKGVDGVASAFEASRVVQLHMWDLSMIQPVGQVEKIQTHSRVSQPLFPAPLVHCSMTLS